MIAMFKRRTLVLSSLFVLPLVAGCDAADIVFASLDLAFAIVNAAT